MASEMFTTLSLLTSRRVRLPPFDRLSPSQGKRGEDPVNRRRRSETPSAISRLPSWFESPGRCQPPRPPSPGSASPGEPPRRRLGRQLSFNFQLPGGSSASRMTSEGPPPSVSGNHPSSYRSSRRVSPRGPFKASGSPRFESFPRYSPAI